MNPLTNVRNIAKLNEQDIKNGVFDHKLTWHSQYKDSAYIFIGGLPYELTEGDVLAVFSQYGEIVNLNLVRDKKTGKSKGYGFLAYEDQRSTILAVDNFNSIKLGGRTIRVDHVSEYRRPLEDEKDENGQRKEKIEPGCAPKTPSPEPSSAGSDEDAGALRLKLKTKKKKKEKKKKKKRAKESNSEDEETARKFAKQRKLKRSVDGPQMTDSDSDADIERPKRRTVQDSDSETDSKRFRKNFDRTDGMRGSSNDRFERKDRTRDERHHEKRVRDRYSDDSPVRDRYSDDRPDRNRYTDDRDFQRTKRRERSRSR